MDTINHCSGCGTSINPTASFCSQCGTQNAEHLVASPNVLGSLGDSTAAEKTINDQRLIEQAGHSIINHENRIDQLQLLLKQEREKLKEADHLLLRLSGESIKGGSFSPSQQSIVSTHNAATQQKVGGATGTPTSSLSRRQSKEKFFSKPWVWVLIALGAVAPLATLSDSSPQAQAFVFVDMIIGAFASMLIAFIIHAITKR